MQQLLDETDHETNRRFAILARHGCISPLSAMTKAILLTDKLGRVGIGNRCSRDHVSHKRL